MDPSEYHAKAEWLRLNPHGMRAQAVRREVRAYERELQARGEIVEEPVRTPRTLSRGYVAYWPDRPGQPLGSNVIHADPHCWQIDHVAERKVRAATEAELERLPRCGSCA